MKSFLNCLLAGGLVLLTGCATVVGDKTQLMAISSTPDKASIKIVDERGSDIYSGTTPASVVLQKSDGTYFGGKEYAITVSKDGFDSQVIHVSHRVTGWYIFGNLMLGGLIGWLVIDPFNGGMYTLKPESVNASLASNQQTPPVGQTTGYNNNAGELHVVLLQDLPAGMRTDLVPVKNSTHP